MIPLKRIAAYVCLATLTASAQTRIDLRSQGKNPTQTGTALPGACSVGDLFVKTDNTPGQNLYLCTASDVWTLQGAAFAGVFTAADSLPSTCSPGTDPELVYLTAGTPGLYQCTAANTWSPTDTSLIPGNGLMMVCTAASCTLAIDPAWPGVTNTPPGYAAASTTSLTVATGPQTLTTQSGLAYSTGASVVLTSTSSGAWMFGVVASYSGTTMALNVATTAGFGTYADWTINLSANPASSAPLGAPNQVMATDPSGALVNTAHLRPLVAGDLPAGYPWMSLAGAPATFSPSHHAATHQNGGSDEVAALAPAPFAIPKAGNNGKLAQGWIDFTGYQTTSGGFPWTQLTGVPSLFYQSVQANGTAQPQRPAINFVPGTNISFSCSDNGGALRTDCTIGVTGLSGSTIPSAAVLKGSGGNAVEAAASDVISLWSGSCASTTFLRGDGACALPGGGSSGGTVTSVGLSLPDLFSVSGSPVTGSGTLAATLANQSPNTVFAGPASGGAGAPGFRVLVAADLPGGYNAATATALSGAPAQCAAGNFATGIAANGNANCAQPAYAQLTGLPSGFTPSAHAATHASGGSDPLSLSASQITSGALAVAQGGTGMISHFVPLGINAPVTQPNDAAVDTLSTLTIPANSLASGSRIHIEIEVDAAINSVTWIPALTLAGTSIASLPGPSSHRALEIALRCTVHSATLMECLALAGGTNGSPYPYEPISLNAITINTSNPIPIVLKGQNLSTSASNAVLYGFAVWAVI